MGRLMALLAALIAAGVIGWAVQRPPGPAPASAPATTFSAARALADIRRFADRPHPIGSPANHAARDYLMGRMAALGLSPEIHKGVGLEQPKWAPGAVIGGDVENLIGVLPGRNRSAPALALMAHYDSVPGSSGAADDGAGVAAALEIVRALKAEGQPARDVMVVITDGEEAGLLGAHAFFERDPAARHVGFVMNLEARGDAGRTIMFQTGPAAGEAVRLYSRAAPRPQATSLAAYVYERMPNDTDFTVARRKGLGGLNFAFAGRQFDYHAASSTPDTLDPGTLQDMGQQALGPARAAAFGPALPAPAPDLVYSQTFGDYVLAYPPAAGWAILAIAAALIGIAAVRAHRREAFAWTDLARGAGGLLFAALGAVAVLHFIRRATGVPFGFLEQRFLLAQAHRWETAAALVGVGFLLSAIAEIARGRRLVALAPLAAGLASSLFGGFDAFGAGCGVAAAVVGVAAYGRPVSRAGAWSGALILGLVLATVLQIVAAPTAFVIAWPLTLAALAAAFTDASARRGDAWLAVLAAIAGVGGGWLAAYGHLTFVLLDLPEMMTLALLGAGLLLWPLAQPTEGAPPERLIGPALIIAGLAVTVAVRVNDPYSPRYPDLSNVVYQTDQDARRAWLVSATPKLPAWSKAVLESGGGKIGKLENWIWRGEVQAAPAPYRPQPTPEITFAKQPDGSLKLRIVPPPGAREIALGLTPDTPVTLDSVQGVPAGAALAPGKVSRLRWAGAAQGLELVLRPAGPGKLTAKYEVTIERWPAGLPPLPKRPADLMAWGESDSTYVTGERGFAW